MRATVFWFYSSVPKKLFCAARKSTRFYTHTTNVKNEVEKNFGNKDFGFEQIDFVPPGAKRAYKVSF